MKRIAILILAAMMVFCPTADARSVTVTGTGTTATEAENDAMRLAVEKAIGVLVDSQTLVENMTIVRDQIYTQSRGFITNYTVRSRQQTSYGWNVTIDADVDDQPNSKLMNELTRLGIIDVQLRNPRIAVAVPSAETSIIKTLIDAGFSNVVEVNLSGALNMNAAQLSQAARQFGVDILIVGEAFSESVGDPAALLPGNQTSHLQSCRARVEAKMFIAKTGQIIAADDKLASATDVAENIAARKALANAGKQMGDYLVNQITGLYTSRQDVKVVVYGADFSKINRVQSAIGNVRGVKSCNLASYEGGRAVFNVMYSGSPQTLFQEIQSASTADIELQEISYNTVTVRVR